MNRKNKLKLVHFLSTDWLILNAVYLMTTALLQAGKSWWFIASLTGHSAIAVFVLINLYLFSIYKGVGRDQNSIQEHPLSNSTYYTLFYDTCPFIGTLAGAIGAIGVSNINHFLLITASGSLWTTFMVWIIVDPVIAMLEIFLPASRAHRKVRLSKVKAKKQEERFNKAKILAELEQNENLIEKQREIMLQPYADQLAKLLVCGIFDQQDKEKAINTGMLAWQIGGIECMKQLHAMVIRQCKLMYDNRRLIDHLSIWWDGIGNWQNSWFDGQCEPIYK